MLNIIFEDESLLVLAKPPGQIVNNAQTTKKEETLQAELEAYFGIKKAEEGIGGRAGIVHRLDKETSGILVVAKDESAFNKLQSQFKERTVEKAYVALVHGRAPKDGEINAPLGRITSFGGKFGVVEGGRPSLTAYRALRYFQIESDKKVEELSFLDLHPQTGRTHQIRVHLKHIGHPVVSDSLYLSPKRLKEDLTFCPRLFLHAASLSFSHPASGARMRFEAELPQDLQSVLDSLKQID